MSETHRQKLCRKRGRARSQCSLDEFDRAENGPSFALFIEACNRLF